MPKTKLPNKNFKWTPELAYSIGLLTTDGNISKDGRHIIMKSSDIQLLNTFKKCLNIKNKIAKSKNDSWAKKPHYRIQFGGVQFYRWLLKIGLFPNKTYTIGSINIPQKYFVDFLRGHLDGDGDISTYKDYYNTYKNKKYIYNRIFTRFRSVSKIHIEWLRNNIFKIISIKGHLIEKKPRREYQTATMWILRFAKKDSIKLFSWLYYSPSIPCLIRKREIAENFIHNMVQLPG
ncbi:MAG: LAGLIDADG family homing endonuclease [Candidatus Parcubacteria bacterium]|nr:LAGLIDADG family homing endonuclease [Candidatus Parcubacteria bacterium]